MLGLPLSVFALFPLFVVLPVAAPPGGHDSYSFYFVVVLTSCVCFLSFYEDAYGRRSLQRSRGSGSFDPLPRAAVFFLAFKARREPPSRYR